MRTSHTLHMSHTLALGARTQPQMATLYQRLQVDRDNISVEEVDSVLRRMSYKKDQDLYNFWLEVRFDVVADQAEQVAIKRKESNE